MNSGDAPVTPRSSQTVTSAGTPKQEGGVVHGSQASYTSDEQSFHKLFPQVPLNEKLVENYQCGLSRSKIVRVGRLYLTSLRLCFHSTFMKESVMVEWENIVDVEKKENFVFEAVIVKVNNGESHYFSAFVYGNTDQAHKMITMLWSVRKRYAGMQLNAASNAPLPPMAPTQPHPTVPVAHRHPRTESTSSIGSVGFEALKAYVPEPQQQSQQTVVGDEFPPLVVQSSTPPLATTFRQQEVIKVEDSRRDDLQAEEEEPLTSREETAHPAVAAATAAETAAAVEAAPASEGPSARTVSPAGVLSKEETAVPVVDPVPLPQPLPPSPQSNSSSPSNMSLSAAAATMKPPRDASAMNQSSPVMPVMDRGTTGSPTHTALPPPVGTKLTAPVPAQNPASSTPQRAVQESMTSPFQGNATTELDPETLALMQQDKHQQQLIRSQSPPVQSRAEKRAEKAIARASAATIATTAQDAPHDVLRHFPNVPKTERVVDTFQCSYVMGVHRLGKLYITSHYVLFNSVMYGEGVCIRITDVSSIEKEQTMVILDGILFKMKNGQSHSFTSFVNRDAAFNILHHFFAAHKQMAADEPAVSLPPATSAAELVPPPSILDEKDTAANSGTESTSSTVAHKKKHDGKHKGTEQHEAPPSSAAKSEAKPSKKKGKKEPKQASANNTSKQLFTTHIAQPSYEQLPVFHSMEDYSKIGTDYGTSLSSYDAFQRDITATTTFPKGFTIFDIFRLAFDDGTKVLEQYHTNRQDTEQKWENWKPASSPHSTHHHRTFAGQRTFLCTTIIRAVMAKACAFTEFQRFSLFMLKGAPHLIVQFSGQAIGVMFSDAFRAETLLVFSQPNAETAEVTLQVKGHIQFLRSVWVKGKILDTALGVEMPESYRNLTALIQKATAASTPMALLTADEQTNDVESSSESESDREVNLQSGPQGNGSSAPVDTVAAAQPVLVTVPSTAPPIPVAAAESIPEPLKMVHAAITGLIFLFTLRGLWTSMIWFDSYAGNYDIMYADPAATTAGFAAAAGGGAGDLLAAAAMARVGSQILHLLRPLVVVGLLLALRHSVLTLGRFALSMI